MVSVSALIAYELGSKNELIFLTLLTLLILDNSNINKIKTNFFIKHTLLKAILLLQFKMYQLF
jgi:hypothetical protein